MLAERDRSDPLAAPEEARWRALPAEFGAWWMVAQTFIRRALLGVGERLLALVHENGIEVGMTYLGGINIQVYGTLRALVQRLI